MGNAKGALNGVLMFWWEPGVFSFTASSPILALLIARVSTPSIGTDSSDQEAAKTNRNQPEGLIAQQP